jgi:uncharacterized protein
MRRSTARPCRARSRRRFGPCVVRKLKACSTGRFARSSDVMRRPRPRLLLKQHRSLATGNDACGYPAALSSQCEAGRRMAKSAKLMQTALIALLRFYKLAVSPLLGNRCRFYPSCSDYAREAIQYHGAAHGTYLAAKRLCRCHPFSAGGIDLVPLPDGSRPDPGLDPDTPFELPTELDAGLQSGQRNLQPRSQPDSTPAAGSAPEHQGSTDFIPHGAPDALIDRH